MRSPGGRVRACALAFSAVTCVLFFHVGTGAQAPAAPRYKFDPDFPKPLPNKWKIGGVMGISLMDVKTGKMVAEVPRAPEGEGGGPNRPAALPQVVPGQGGQGPIARFLPQPPGGSGGRGRGNADLIEYLNRLKK